MKRLILVGMVAAAACKRSPPTKVAAPSGARELPVPIASGAIELDGEPEEPAWRDAIRTGPFADARGAQAKPFTEARFLRDRQTLYVHLYAADDDLRCPTMGNDGPVWICDRFRLAFHGTDGDRVLTVTPRGGIADGFVATGAAREDRTWSAGARIGADTDGTIDRPGDDDEEWAVELAVPLDRIGARAGRAAVTIERFDVGGKGGRRSPSRYDAVLLVGDDERAP